MNITESNESSQEPGGSRLSVEQLNAIDVLVQGRTDQETAETVGVARETVTRWRNDNPHFAAQLNRQRRFIWDSCPLAAARPGVAPETLHLIVERRRSLQPRFTQASPVILRLQPRISHLGHCSVVQRSLD